MKEVTYDINSVTNKLSARIATLEVQLAHEQSVREAYQKRAEELTAEKEALDKETDAE